MRNIRVDTRGTRFMVAGDVAPKIGDPSTGEVKTDAQGRTLYQLFLLPMPNDDKGAAIQVTVPATEQPAFAEGEPVEVTGLVAFPWEMNDGRHGIAFRAESIISKNGRGVSG